MRPVMMIPAAPHKCTACGDTGEVVASFQYDDPVGDGRGSIAIPVMGACTAAGCTAAADIDTARWGAPIAEPVFEGF